MDGRTVMGASKDSTGSMDSNGCVQKTVMGGRTVMGASKGQ